MHRALSTALLVTFLSVISRAQELPELGGYTEVLNSSIWQYCLVQRPASMADGTWVPLLILLPGRSVDAAAAEASMREVGFDAARAGFLVVAPISKGDEAVHGAREFSLPRLLSEVRADFHIAQGGAHVVVCSDWAEITPLLLQHREQFQSFTVLGNAKDDDVAALRKLPARRVHVLPDGDAAARQRHFAALRAEREFPRAAADVARTLDDFHDAAAKGDEARYFAILPDDAVFLGTDLSERWTGAQFRAHAMPYFQRAEAWTYFPLQRHITMEPGDTVAWFDEVLANSSYGECRGTGVLVKRGERWVLRQYDLTIPIPNELAGGFAQRIRSFADGQAPAVTTILIVRTAEQLNADMSSALRDAGHARAESLARAVRDLPIAAIFPVGGLGAEQTVAPLCRQLPLAPSDVRLQDLATLADRLRRDHPGRTTVVCTLRSQIGKLMRDLGVSEIPSIGDEEFDRLFVVTLAPGGARLLSLRY